MTDLVQCCDGSEPVIQTRDKMGPGDYFGVTLPNGAPDHDHHLKVEMHDAIRNDIRVACKACGMATGWTQRDLPNMPFAGQDYAVKTWNALASHKKQRQDMINHLEGHFDPEVVAKHFSA